MGGDMKTRWSGRGKESTGERVIESVREADGDEGLGRVAKPLRKRDKTLWIHCIERQRIKGQDKEAEKMETVALKGVMGAGRE